MSIWTIFILQPLVNLFIFIYDALGGSLGLTIIAVTLIVRLSLIPLTGKGMKSAQKMQDLKPELDKLKEKYKDDKQALATAQLELYKKHDINPAGGILPMILQFVVLIGLFQVYRIILNPGITVEIMNEYLYGFLQLKDGFHFNPHFFYWNLTTPDVIQLQNPISIFGLKLSALPGVLLILSVVIQFVSARFMMPKPAQPIKKKKTDEPDMGAMMQKQMMIMMPLMTLIIGYSFPTGLVIYWLTFSMIMVVQQMFLKRNSADKQSK